LGVFVGEEARARCSIETGCVVLPGKTAGLKKGIGKRAGKR
jgi:hypothetical protein